MREFWSEERIALLKKMHADCYSCTQIAAQLGATSRSAVIGKLHRLGLSQPRPKPSISMKPRRAAARTAPAVVRSGPLQPSPRPSPAKATPIETEPADDPAPPIGAEPARGKTLLSLRDHHCRWPIGHPGNPDFHFCGDPTAALSEGRPYCAQHERLAYAR